ncbi:MAG: DNA repair protein RecN [Deltaproteobacteria bacterium]|nr:DNA repair protein RecN [Deltaproteobacteria bacterium]
MLVHLSIRDFALMDRLELSFNEGMAVFTGETGAGKSILLNALSVLSGARAKGDVIRQGKQDAEVAGQFALSGLAKERVDALLQNKGLPPCDEGNLLVRRVLSQAGRHRQFINGSMTTVAHLKDIIGPLVDFTGQHAAQALMRPEAQLNLLDGFGGLHELRSEVNLAYDQAKVLLDERRDLFEAEQNKAARADYLRFQLEEIDDVEPMHGEMEPLEQERERLKNVASIRQGILECSDLLVDAEASALSQLQRAHLSLENAAKSDDGLQELLSRLAEAVAIVDDAAMDISHYQSGLEENPHRLTEVDDRLDALRTLCRKHGPDLEQVLQQRESMAEELDAIDHAEERLQLLEAELEKARLHLEKKSQLLHERRKTASISLAKETQQELADLSMKQAKLDVAVLALAPGNSALSGSIDDENTGFSRSGCNRVELMLAANAGEGSQPLAKAASGGELSRVLLALKRCLLQKDPAPISVFDEVDAGVGGAIGEVIGEKLSAIAAGRQVLCVTHLGQIASQAHVHFKVEKETDGERTVSRIATLNDDERIQEVARMLGGKVITDATLDHAQEMVERGLSTSKPPSNKKKSASAKVASEKNKPKAKSKTATKAKAAKTRIALKDSAA